VSHPKKVGALPVEGGDAVKQTNEIGMCIPLLEGLDIEGKDITADALLTQRKLAAYLTGRGAYYHFTVKGNQPTIENDIALLFRDRKAADFESISPPVHGRIETRRIWCSTALNAYIDFPDLGQVFLIERETVNKKTGKLCTDIALGMTRCTPEQANPERLLTINRGHWTIENRCHYVIDWNFDEDRCRIRTGYGPENMSRLRRFAVGVIQCFSNGKSGVAEKTRRLNRNTRLVFDYLRMTSNSTQPSIA
jgi:predicted transposase YbfD/YdcC